MTRSERRTARIAVDLLGGDDAPAVVVDGALQALNADAALRLMPVGPLQVLDGLVARVGAALRDRIDPVPVDEMPVRRAALLVGAGRADAVVSAGATGATVKAAVASCGRYPRLARPALAVTVPTRSGPLVLLDVGASPTPTGADLARHAVLGIGYAVATLGLTEPRVGLLSIGTERGSGDRTRRDAAALLAVLPLPGGGRYVGLVEGHDVPLGGPADVVVTDGFTGNVLLKGIEGALRLAAAPDVPGHPGTGSRPAGGGGVFDGSAHAATLLGVPAPVVVCHGAATAADLASGIALAARLVTEHAIERVSAVAGHAIGRVPAPGHRPTGQWIAGADRPPGVLSADPADPLPRDPTDQPAGGPAGALSTDPAEPLSGDLTDQPAGGAADRLPQDLAGQPSGGPADRPSEDPAYRPPDDPADRPVGGRAPAGPAGSVPADPQPPKPPRASGGASP